MTEADLRFSREEDKKFRGFFDEDVHAATEGRISELTGDGIFLDLACGDGCRVTQDRMYPADISMQKYRTRWTMKYKVAIFDMDGTILDTLEDLADSMNFCLRKYGMPERSLEEIKRFVGNGVRRLVELAVSGGTDEKIIDEMCATYIEYYKNHCAIKTRPYEGIREVLKKLKEKGVLTAVVSNKADHAVKKLCEEYFDGLFDYAAGDREGMRRKPYPDSVISVMEHFGANPEEVVYIGDSEVDLQTARNAGVDVIMVSWGFRDEDCLRSIGAEKIIHIPDEILKEFL